MKLDFLICASPTTGFFSQIAFFRLCLNRLGGDYVNARLVAVFGDHKNETIPDKWRNYFDEIEVEWAHPIGAINPDYRAQHDRRFELIRKDADIVFLCDADIAPIRPPTSLISILVDRPALAGAIAHFHFPRTGISTSPKGDWSKLAEDILGKKIDTPNKYSLASPDAPAEVPFYINFGMFAGTPELMKEFYLRDLQIREAVAEKVGHYWAPQVSLPLVCADLSIPTLPLPMRYNYPNDSLADSYYPDELQKVIFLHYLRMENFRRDKIFASKRRFMKLLSSRLSGSDEIFRSHVEAVTAGIYPFA